MKLYTLPGIQTVVFLLILQLQLANAQNHIDRPPESGKAQQAYPQIAGDNSIIELTEGWEYRWGDSPKDKEGRPVWSNLELESEEWKPMSLPGWAPGRGDNNYLWQRIRLPGGKWTDPSIYLLSYFLFFEVYLDDKLIYSFGDLDSPAKLKFQGTPWHIIPLPADFEGKLLSFRFYSAYYLIGIGDRVYLGSQSGIYRKMIIEDADRLIVGSLSVFIGLFALTLFLGFSQSKEYFALAFSALWIGTYIIRYTCVKQLLFGGSLFWNYIWVFSLFCMPLGIILFVEKMFGAGPKSAIRLLWQAHITLSVILLFLILCFTEEFGIFVLKTVRMMYLLYFVVISVWVGFSAFRGEVNAKIFLAGFISLVVFGLHDVLVGLGVVPWLRPIAHYGMFLFIVSLTVILGRTLVEMYRDVKEYSRKLELMRREKEGMVLELHDGISGIMSNINLLAEIAGKKYKTGAGKKAFSTISTLSREGISEIRDFMHSLDDRETNWDSLASELRHFGSSTLEAMGMKFAITIEIEREVTQPNSFLYLNLQRIFKEAITNIARHSRAGNVKAGLAVTHQLIRLDIIDDGIGLGDLQGKGRGISHMKARAKELGGELTICSQNGTRLQLVVPYPKNNHT
ncbi:MAG: hypothetical protein DRP87_19200 [Spirochaetes bacterium]|nr:MAG: hypothetical protein DRP87_19200 [Spirochaetota bacterium]